MQFDERKFTVPITSGGATTNNYPTGGFTTQDAPSEILMILANSDDFTSGPTYTVGIVDGLTGTIKYVSGAIVHNTKTPLEKSIVIFPGDYIQVITSGDTGGTYNVYVTLITQRGL